MSFAACARRQSDAMVTNIAALFGAPASAGTSSRLLGLLFRRASTQNRAFLMLLQRLPGKIVPAASLDPNSKVWTLWVQRKAIRRQYSPVLLNGAFSIRRRGT